MVEKNMIKIANINTESDIRDILQVIKVRVDVTDISQAHIAGAKTLVGIGSIRYLEGTKDLALALGPQIGEIIQAGITTRGVRGDW